MGVHKLTAGDGYSYLTRQVAAHDATEKGHTSLGDYYTQRGEAPGRWLGEGLAGLGMSVGEDVTAVQMTALFGEGRHPNATVLQDTVIAAGGTTTQALAATALGRPFAVYQGANTFQTAVAREFTAANLTAGRSWNAPIPAPERALIRTAVGTRLFAEEFGRPPADARELSGFIARASRPATSAVAGYDLTFSPVKSVSALWAIAPRKISGQIEDAHDAAVADTLAWLERQAAFTRTGPAGIRQVPATGLIAAAFTHRDARSGDPDLHTHVAISNKVQTTEGKWLALDGRVLYKANVAASERYNTRLEAELTARLGLTFSPRPGTDQGNRAVREIVGVDPRLNLHWSTRRAAIDTRRAHLATRFQADHGRPPTAVEAISLAQQATLETRHPKHEPRSLAEERATWREQALRVLGGPDALTQMVTTATSPETFPHRHKAGEMTETTIAALAASVLNVVQGSRATWQVWHVRAEAERHARTATIPLSELDSMVDRIVAAALGEGFSIRLGVEDPISEPAPLRRADGTSMYRVAGSTRYTSSAILDAEQTLLAAARRTDGRAVSRVAVGLALAESAANGLTLTPGQAQLVTDLATSGARVQVAIAPAGSGKTTAMRTLAAAWTSNGGTIIGLAPSARAATELGDALGPGARGTGTRSDTLAKLTHSLTTGLPPAWVDGIGPSTLVIIDEAGMAATTDLATTVTYILGRGGSIRLVGDDQQLASVAAGGVLRDIADQVGALTLTELHRFTDPAEGAATLALRDGDPAAIGFYLDQGRVHVGDLTGVTDQAYDAWAADRARGVDAVMLAPTRDLVAILNSRARADRLRGTDQQLGREVALADGNAASVGDVVITRRNDRYLPISATDWVKNGDRWVVRDAATSGAVTAQHLATSRVITLPAEYVAAHVELGYASTVHGAQGSTADTSHLIATGTESRQLLYVGMTRARLANHVYLATATDGDPHDLIRPETVSPLTGTDILTAILHRDQAQESATTVARRLADPAILLRDAAARYHDALTVAAEHILGADALAQIDAAADQVHAGLTTAAAYPSLRAHLALLALDGTDAVAALRAVTGPGTRELDTAADPAAVLDWRLTPTRTAEHLGPLPWLPPIPAGLASHDQWGPYLTARAQRVTELAAHVRDQASSWTPTTAPSWAVPLLDTQPPNLLGDVAVWRAATGTGEKDRRPTGPPQAAAAAGRYQHVLDVRVSALLGELQHAATTWAPAIQRLEPRIIGDPFWPELAIRLAAIDRAGIDTRGLLTAAIGEKPLPDDHPAAALWWRLSRHLTPAVVAATGDTSTLRPTWTTDLTARLGTARADRVTADPAWPALVTALSTHHDGWTSDTLLAAAIDLTPTDVPDADLATALVWQVSILTDPEPVPADTLPPDPRDGDLQPPADLHLLEPATGPHTDDRPLPPGEPAGSGAAVHADLGRAIEVATRLRGPLEPTDAEQWAALDEDYKWATAVVPRERLVDLNNQAAAFFTNHYTRSWAPDYLTDRLGTDLTGDDRFTPGYAPAGWTALTTHLRAHGATDEEIIAAGIGRLASTGRVIDQFRDRLVFPIHGPDGDIHGFIGRRNPHHDGPAGDSGRGAGPKYLNTPSTDLFDKGAQLFGLHEGHAALAAGAVPVLVEGPLDAIAITLASNGRYVGVAALGTAFGDTHANQLVPYIGDGKPSVIIATDADPAGWKAAQRAYWHLAIRGEDPAYIAMPDGTDPAEIVKAGGPAALQHLLIDRQPLARILIDSTIRAQHEKPTADRTATTRDIADVIAALPPNHWTRHIDHATGQLGIQPGIIEHAIIDAAGQWTADRRDMAKDRIRTSTFARPPSTVSLSSRSAIDITAETQALPAPDGQTQPAWYQTSPAIRHQQVHHEAPAR